MNPFRLKLLTQFIFAIAISIFGNSLFAADEVAESTNYTFSLPSKDGPEVKWWRDSQTNLDARFDWKKVRAAGSEVSISCQPPVA